MLTLSRYPNQSIMIGDYIEVKVINIIRGQVKLGIAAPKDVPVHREEVYLKILREQEENN